MNEPQAPVTGVILAGGQGSRLNYQDKPLLDIGGKSIIEHIISNAQTQVTRLVVSVNRNPDKFANLGPIIIQDRASDPAGPLTGILSAIRWCRDNDQDLGYVACFPGDVPWFPADIVTRLLTAVTTADSETGWICTDGQWQPLFSLWSVRLHDRLAVALENNVYSPMRALQSTHHVVVEINGGPPEHFLNINTPEDLERARHLAAFPTAAHGEKGPFQARINEG